jgi:cation transport ATPase
MLGMEPGSLGIDAGPLAVRLTWRLMTSKRSSRKRRRQRRAAGSPPARAPAAAPPPQATQPPAAGYARSRAKDEQARAALKPLRPGERPPAVTAGAIAATVLAVANLVALAFGYNSGEDTLSPGSEVSGSILTTLVVALVAYGMWRARYWGVLGMQTLLVLTLIVSSLALLFANSLWAALLLVIIIGASGTLFWFLVKAMARIQMPERPSRSQRTS